MTEEIGTMGIGPKDWYTIRDGCIDVIKVIQEYSKNFLVAGERGEYYRNKKHCYKTRKEATDALLAQLTLEVSEAENRLQKTKDKLTKLKESMATTFTPGPWQACNNGECSCYTIWSISADTPICKVESGEWGDRWPAIKVESEMNDKAEAYMEFCAYGSIPEEEAKGNIYLITKAPDMYDFIKDKMHHLPIEDQHAASVLLAKARGR